MKINQNLYLCQANSVKKLTAPADTADTEVLAQFQEANTFARVEKAIPGTGVPPKLKNLGWVSVANDFACEMDTPGGCKRN